MEKLVVTAVEVRATPRRYAALAILLVLFSTGWAANHFAALLPALADTRGLSRAALNGAFGIYALGLLPGLLASGGLSDRLGRRPVVLCGALVAALGNLIMLAQPDQTGILLGRLILGVGVGLTVSAGTVWTAEVHGEGGAIAAGVALTAGFALGPLFSGLTSQAMRGGGRSVHCHGRLVGSHRAGRVAAAYPPRTACCSCFDRAGG
ncbi:hypothetical protein MSTO_58670 [Mycobacterium stomatepiae]|uniref:Major facilitator superfamily (MFS) profile domain-containing protein n=1 Tax=Mycobacterium stomatepiae TaxID=470076 RepID=A0A7I7QHH1_9MYCO|nr:hypothetical protein MSTO_58670 [Mycobacterium stomatepiae]